MKVFITGGMGFIGTYVGRSLAEQGHAVVAYDALLNFVHPAQSHYPRHLQDRMKWIDGKVTLVQGDVRHKSQLQRALVEARPDAVCHLAALPIASASNRFSEDAMEINLQGLVNVLEALRDVRSARKFVFASSSFVYGDFQRPTADETHPTSPIDVYGGTKLAGEVLVQAYGRKFDIPYVIIRPSAVYGPTDANRRVTQIFVENALCGKPMVVHDGGQSRVDFTYVEDTAQGFVKAITRADVADETFNITYGEGRSILEMGRILQKLVPGARIEERPKDERRPERGTLDIGKAKRLLGYEPAFPLEEGMRLYVDYVRKSGIA